MSEVPAGSVVVGVDGSSTSDRAVDWAAEQARLESRDLTLVHATGTAGTATLLWMDQAGVDSVAAVAAVRQEAERLLQATADRLADVVPEVTVRGVVAELDPREALRELTSQAALLVVGSRGRGPVASLLLGSVAHAVTRDPACPVVVVRPEGGHAAREGVLVGVDEAGTSTHALDFAYRLAAARRLPLRVVHCIFDVRAPTGDVGPGEAGYDAERLLLAETVSGMAEQHPDVRVTTVLTRGLVDRTLVRLGEAAEVVVVGAHHRGPVAGIVHGRTAATVTEHSTGIVVVVPEPD